MTLLLKRLFVAASLVTFFGSAVQAKTVAAEPVLAPHRIVYEISLSDKKKSSAEPASLYSMTGRMVYELTGDACDGYSVTQRLVTSSELVEGDANLEDVQTASFEGPEGKALQFVVRRLLDQKLRQTLRGSALTEGETTQLFMKEPSKQELTLSHDVVFPMAYFRQLIATAMRGETIMSAYLFDGADRIGEYLQTTASIGRERTAAVDDGPLARIKGIRRWPVTVAYFAVGEKTQGMAPLYEISTELYENGINSDLYLDFGSYALDAKVKELKMLPKTSCR